MRHATNEPVVFDASALVRALVDRSEPALERLRLVAAGETRGIVPDLVFPEAANVLVNHVRAGALSPPGAVAHLRWIVDSPLEVVPVSAFAETAVRIALSHDLSAYDASYFAAALVEDATLVTADGPLAAAYPRSVLIP